MSAVAPSTRQLPLPLAPAPAPGFDNFLPGANAAACDHLRQLAPAGPPVYLWGPPGSGKTHLLQATLRAARAAGRVATALPRSGAVAPPVATVTDAAADTVADRMPRPALIVIDDCDALDAEAQARAFSAFVDAAAHGAALVAAGRVPPVDLPVREDLRTRLGWGLVFALKPLGETELRAALRQEAARRGLTLSDDLVHHLLTRFARDLSQLMPLLDRLDRYALARSRALTVPLLRAMLQEPDPW
jgi:DnaA-homolog protein